MDPLSQILTLLRPRSTRTAALDVAGPWSLLFPPDDGVKFCAVEYGNCWIRTDTDTQWQPLTPGDCYLVSQGRAFVLASDPSLAPVEAATQITLGHRGLKSIRGGGDYLIVSCLFEFSEDQVARLLHPLPGIFRVPADSEQANFLRRAMGRLATELKSPRPGTDLVAEHLGHLMLVEMLRLFIDMPHSTLTPGWLQAAADPQIAKAIRAMHDAPADPWQLAGLAGIAGMSRAVFAQRFKLLMGTPVIEYLTRWRMLLAGEKLHATNDSIASIAAEVGYGSEYAFSTAFARVMGCPPGRYRREARLPPA
jgi:AraC-like DNA-binding protein